MLQALTNDSKQNENAARTAATHEPQRTLPPGTHPGAMQMSQRLAGLQRAVGNQAVLRMLSRASLAIQTKLTISQPGDRYEQEADRVAEQIMRILEPEGGANPHASPSGEVGLQRKCTECEEEEKLHRKEAAVDGSAGAVAPPIV